jgi:serine kinase of HPr protein (carbohydrate metabolism regulator)
MKIKEIIELTEARALTEIFDINLDLCKAFSSDLMSDVLTLEEHQILLITGLANIQMMRTVEIADIPVVLLSRNKPATPEMIEMAIEHRVVLLETSFSLFRASGVLYQHGMKHVF